MYHEPEKLKATPSTLPKAEVAVTATDTDNVTPILRTSRTSNAVDFVNLASTPELVEETARLINSFWRRPLARRVESLRKSIRVATEKKTAHRQQHWSKSSTGATAHFILIRRGHHRHHVNGVSQQQQQQQQQRNGYL